MPRVMITGVNRGLGLEFIKQYADAGWSVIGTCRDLDAASDAKQVAEQSGKVSLYPLDVTDAAAVQALADQLKGTVIDVLILNAGIMGQKSVTLGQIDAEDYRRVLDANVVAPTMCAQAFREHVLASERKTLVGIGSFLGSIASNDDGGLHSYRSSKAGMHAVMHTLSIDLRDAGAIAIAMHPGWVKTDMGGENAMINTQESIAGMIRVIDGLKPTDSGRLLTYSGDELPW